MATLESKPLVTSCSNTFKHPMSTNNQVTLITCRGNNISVDDTHAAVNYCHSPSYIGSSSNCLINSTTNLNQVANGCIRTGALEIVRGLAFNNGGVCKLDSVKKTAVSAPGDKNCNNIAKDDHDTGCANKRTISSVAPYYMSKSSHDRKSAAISAGENSKNKMTRDCHDHDNNDCEPAVPMIVACAVMKNDGDVHEASHCKKKPIAVAKGNPISGKHEHDRCGVAGDISRRRSQRICMLQSPGSSLDVQSSLCDIKSNNVDSGVLHEWLQAMRETSPPRRTLSPSSNATSAATSSANSFSTIMPACTSSQYNHTNTESIEDLQLIHRAWMAKHPSALEMVEEIVEAASGKRVAVFLDYDGTLSPIVQDPDRAFMSHQMRAIVKEVANVFPTAIISGRCKEKLHEFVQLPELYYAGCHGMEIIAPAKHYHSFDASSPNDKGEEASILYQPAKEFTLLIDKVFKVLEEKTKGVPGAKVEHNKFCVSVHFRCVKERHWVTLAQQVHEVIQSYPNVRLTPGRKVLEIRPLIAWNKGKALDFLLEALGLNDQNTTFPIYLGDDRSDEDAFKVLNRKKHGLGILVTTVAKETNAVCSLRDPSEVGELLKHLVKWKCRHLNKYL